MITLVERHVINEHYPYFDEYDHLAFLSKNLYNTTLYCMRQIFFLSLDIYNIQSYVKIYSSR